MPLDDYARLRRRLSDIAFVDATDVVRSLRMVKSEAEIAKIATVCRIVSDAFEAVPQNVGTGETLADVFTGFRIDLLRRGADEVPYLIGAAAPGGYDNVIAPPGEAPLEPGDILMMDTGATGTAISPTSTATSPSASPLPQPARPMTRSSRRPKPD